MSRWPSYRFMIQHPVWYSMLVGEVVMLSLHSLNSSNTNDNHCGFQPTPLETFISHAFSSRIFMVTGNYCSLLVHAGWHGFDKFWWTNSHTIGVYIMSVLLQFTRQTVGQLLKRSGNWVNWDWDYEINFQLIILCQWDHKWMICLPRRLKRNMACNSSFLSNSRRVMQSA